MNHLSYYSYQAEARGVTEASAIERIANSNRHLYEKIVLPWLPSDRNAKIAELACGHGSFMHWLCQAGYSNVLGVDLSPEQTRFASQLGLPIATADAIVWLQEQQPESYDVLVAIDFAEHVHRDDFMEVLYQAGRVLKSGGCLILRLPNGESPFVGMNLFNDITHVWTYTPNCLATLGRMHGLHDASFEDEGTAAIRDNRWIMVPVSTIVSAVLRLVIRAAIRSRPRLLHPNLWTCLKKSEIPLQNRIADTFSTEEQRQS
jgi:SAM-dependent methyltransferase